MMNRKSFLYIILPVILGRVLEAQELTPAQQKYIGQVIENITEQNENSEDVSVVFDDLLDYLLRPLNLNTATAEELGELHVLSPFQIAALIDYRKNRGDLLTIYELSYIPGYRQEDIDMIEPFVVCSEPVRRRTGIKAINSYTDQQVIIRYQRIIEQQGGYVPVPDSILAIEPDKTRYLGSPDKLYCRYKVDMGGSLRAGILMEKDAGEEFFRGSNPKGFDFYSGYIDYRNNPGLLRRFLLGDFHVQMGQGLLAWSSYSYGKSSFVSDICREKETLKASSSAEENRLFRGTAVTLGKGCFTLTTFASIHETDASFVSDTTQDEIYVRTFTTTGYHATPSDLEKENSVKLSSMGGCLQYNNNRLRMDLNAISVRTDKPVMEPEELYKAYYFSGRNNSGISADYRYLGKRARFFGEAACTGGAFSVINGMLLYLKPELNLGIIHRHYDMTYYAFWADAFGENSLVANEDGFYLGMEGDFSGNNIRIYSDIFSFPWLRYRVNAPSAGYEVFGEWEKTWGEADLYFRYKREQKPVNYEIEDNTYTELPLIREQYRLNNTVPTGSYFTFQNRVEISRAGFREDTFQLGFLIYQDIIIRSLPVPIDISMRIGYFNAEDYATRIYAYERDLLYIATSQMHYGKGWRYMLLLKWQPVEKVSFWFKIGQTLYPGADSVGSGLTAIEGNHRTEIKLQMMVKL